MDFIGKNRNIIKVRCCPFSVSNWKQKKNTHENEKKEEGMRKDKNITMGKLMLELITNSCAIGFFVAVVVLSFPLLSVAFVSTCYSSHNICYFGDLVYTKRPQKIQINVNTNCVCVKQIALCRAKRYR